MTSCERIRADAAGLAALPAGDTERREAFAHARECSACARVLEEAERSPREQSQVSRRFS